MRKIMTFILALFVVMPAVFAHGEEGLPITDSEGTTIATAHLEEDGQLTVEPETDEFMTDLAKASLEANAQEKPGVIVKLINNEVINLYIESEQEPMTLGMRTDANADVTELRVGTYAEPTLNIYVKDSVLQEAQNAQGLDFVTNALDKGDIRLEGIGVANKLKLTLAKIGLKVAGWFV